MRLRTDFGSLDLVVGVLSAARSATSPMRSSRVGLIPRTASPDMRSPTRSDAASRRRLPTTDRE